MKENYVEYILADCKGDRISRTCITHAITDAFIMAAKAKFCGQRYIILDQGNIIYALRDYLNEQRESAFSEDAKKLYDRCTSKVDDMFSQKWNRINVSYDELFELLVDINWLVSSIWTAEKKQRVDIPLEKNMEVVHTRLRDALENNFRQQAYRYEEQCGYIEESAKVKNQFFSGLCFDPEVQKYIPLSTYEREELLRQLRDLSVQKMTLYYALTATLIKSEKIRRVH